MANARVNNVIFIDTTGYTSDIKGQIRAIKYLGNTSGTASLTAGTSGSGVVLWQEAGANNTRTEEVKIRVQSFHVAVTNGAKVIIYLEY